MYCSNCGQTRCTCYCRGCGSAWMSCQGSCNRPPMFTQRGSGSGETSVILHEGGKLIDEAFYAVIMFVVPILGFMGVQAALNANESMAFGLRVLCFVGGSVALVLTFFMWKEFNRNRRK